MSDKPDWKKQIEDMKPNEGDELKSLQKKQGRESRRKKKEEDKLKYKEFVKQEKEKRGDV